MNTWSNMNIREKVLMSVLAVTMILGGYLFTRGADLNKQRLVLEDRIESAEKKLTKARKKDKKVEIPELDGKRIGSRDVKKITQQVERERALLSGYGHAFVDLRDQTKVSKLIGEINQRAKASNLHLLSKNRSSASLSQTVRTSSGKAASSLNRPLYELRLQGGYSALFRFIKQLSSLEYSVVPTQLQINRTDRMALGGGRVLDIEITLAL